MLNLYLGCGRHGYRFSQTSIRDSEFAAERAARLIALLMAKRLREGEDEKDVSGRTEGAAGHCRV
jgi:hypothetical protein